MSTPEERLEARGLAVPEVAKPVAAYVPAVRTGSYVFTSGQLPLDPTTGKLVEGDIRDRARRCLDNIAAIAVAAGTSLDKSVKVTIFLTDINDFKQVNEIYATIFREPYPARSAIQVAALPLSADIEIEAVIAI